MTNGNGVEKLDLIFELARRIVSNTDVDSLLAQTSADVARLTRSEAASILLLDATKQQLTFKAATGEKGASMKRFYVPVGQGIAGWVAKNGKALVINDVASDTRFTGHIDKSSGFSTRSILAIPMFAQGDLIGVVEALNKVDGGFTDTDQRLLESLGALAAVAIHNAKMTEDYKNFFSHTMEIITTAIEGSDTRMTGHSYRVAEVSCRIGRQLGFEKEDYRNLYYGAILHDLGMVAVHDLRYLPGAASKTIERTPDKLHPLIGAELVKDIRLLAGVAPIIKHHHELFDGSGHPDGLVGDDIPLAARIVCLAEHLDEIHMSGATGDDYHAQAARMAQSGAGTKFDPAVVDAFMALSIPAAA